MLRKISIRDIRKNLAGKKILLRSDLNTPLKNGLVADSTRIDASIPTIDFLLENGAKVIKNNF